MFTAFMSIQILAVMANQDYLLVPLELNRALQTYCALATKIIRE